MSSTWFKFHPAADRAGSFILSLCEVGGELVRIGGESVKIIM